MTDRDLYSEQEADGFARLCRIALRTVLGAAAVIVGCITPTELPAPTLSMRVGVGSHGNPNEAQQLASLGTITRVTHYVGEDRVQFAGRVRELQAAGLEVLVVQHTFTRDTVGDIAALVASTPGVLVQALNEPDALGYTGAQYAALMRRLVNALPNVQFVGCGLASTDGQPNSRTPDVLRQAAFLRAYRRAGGPPLHAVAIHVYGLPLGARVHTLVQAARAATDAPLWLTEFGVDDAWVRRVLPRATAAQIDSVQAAEMASALTAAQASGVAVALAYNLWDARDGGFGLLRADATTQRPAFDIVRGHNGGRQ